MSNPILQRELVAVLRSSRAAWALAGTVGLLTGLVLLLWPSGGVYTLGEQASHTLINVVSLGSLLLAFLIAPSFTATSLTMEKENRSYDLLTHTLLRPGQIAWGKVVSAQAFLLLLVLSLLPVLAGTLFLGGAGPGQLVLIVAVTLAATVTVGLVGFAVSAWSRESFTSLVITYSLALVWMTLPLLPPLLLRQFVAELPWLAAAAYCSPLSAMLNLVEPDLFLRMALPVASKAALQIYFGGCLIFSIGAWLAGTFRILVPESPRTHTGANDPDGGQKVKFPYVLIDPRRRKRLIGNWVNPVLAKELRSKTFGQAPWIIRGMYATFTISLVLVGLMLKGGAGLHPDVLRLVMISFQILVVLLLVPALMAGAVTQEVERKQFDLLRQTPLSPHTYLAGKTFSAWLLVLLLLVAGAPMWWMMAYLESYQWTSTIIGLAVVLVTLVFASAASLVGALLGRTTATATAIAYAMVSIPAFGALVPFGMGDVLSPKWRTAILSWNPFTAGLQAVSDEFLKGEALLWKPYLRQTLAASACFLAIAWLLLWNRLRREER